MTRPLPTPRFTTTMLISLAPAGASALATFRERAAPLFAQYDLRVERVLSVRGKGQIVGENRFEQPDLIQVVSFPSAEQFKAYVSDPRYTALASARDAGLRRLTVLAGLPLDVAGIATPGSGPLGNRLYGVGLARFKPGGAAGMDEFNRRAQALFARHGMHIESTINIARTLTPVGASEDMNPERVVIFFLDDATALTAYVADPEYQALAPIRDSGLETYDFFLGNIPQLPQ